MKDCEKALQHKGLGPEELSLDLAVRGRGVAGPFATVGFGAGFCEEEEVLALGGVGGEVGG